MSDIKAFRLTFSKTESGIRFVSYIFYVYLFM